MKNVYREHVEQIAGDMAVISIPEFGLREILPTTMEVYQSLLKELQSPTAVAEVILELVAIARLQGADMSDEKISAVESELLNYLYAPRDKREPKLS